MSDAYGGRAVLNAVPVIRARTYRRTEAGECERHRQGAQWVAFAHLSSTVGNSHGHERPDASHTENSSSNENGPSS